MINYRKGHLTMRGSTTGRPSWLGLALAAALAVPLVGCSTDSILRVDNRDIIPPGGLANPAGAAALRAGAIGDFAFAMDGNNGGTEGQYLVSGMLADEWMHSGTFSTRQEYDQRAIEIGNATLTGVFRNLHRARISAERAAAALTASTPTATAEIAEMRNLVGFTYVNAGENYCSGVPFSEVASDGTITPGTPITTTETFQAAISRFDLALGGATAGSVEAYTAMVGKARAQVDMGDYASAATTVAGVPTSFRYVTEHSANSGRQENGIYVFNTRNERFSIANGEGGTGLLFRGSATGTNPALADPRNPWMLDPGNGVGFDGGTPQYDALNWPVRESPVIVASGTEARLIEAEAQLAAGSPAWLTTLNTLRAGVTGLAPLVDPGTAAARVDLLFSERAFWLFGTGHRLGDLRRLIRQYGRGSETVFPTGPYFKGGTYGPDVNLPVPLDEQNNPNFTQCIDRSA